MRSTFTSPHSLIPAKRTNLLSFLVSFASFQNFFNLQIINYIAPTGTRSRDSVVGIATRYGLRGSGIKSRWGRDFPHPSKPALGPYPVSYTMATGPLPGVNRPGRCVGHPPHLVPTLRKE